MPPKAKLPAPIDRPLSRAYLRQFTGWSSAYPPGLSDPTSLRIMENVQINRDGSCRVRPGLRYLSFASLPVGSTPGTKLPNQMIGTHEAFYLNDGSKAYLFAVKESSGAVGFRVLRNSGSGQVISSLTAAGVGFVIPQGEAAIQFSSATTYVKYVQIDNKILALSNANEPMRIFTVNATKTVKRMNPINVPAWELTDKLTVVHPDAGWISTGVVSGNRKNQMPNPSLETSAGNWGAYTGAQIQRIAFSPAASGNYVAEVKSIPQRTNLIPQPLHNLTSTGLTGWTRDFGGTAMYVSGGRLHLESTFTVGSATGPMTSVVEGTTYNLSMAMQAGPGVTNMGMYVQWFNASGTGLGVENSPVSLAGGTRTWLVTAPAGAAYVRPGFSFGSPGGSTYYAECYNAILSKSGESTSFFSGDTGANFFWTGSPNDSPSIYHPPQDIKVGYWPVSHDGSSAASISVAVRSAATSRAVEVWADFYTGGPLGDLALSSTPGTGTTTTTSWIRVTSTASGLASTALAATLFVMFKAVARNEVHYVDAAMFEPNSSGAYFDGSTPDTATITYDWDGTPHASSSRSSEYATGLTIPPSETKTANTLISSDNTKNVYNFGFFYTFSNEVGESAASMVTVIRAQRGWSQWRWESANPAGEPSGTPITDPDAAADQLIAYMPNATFDIAKGAGATAWNLYAFTWSDQEPVPVTAVKIGTREIKADSTYANQASYRMTPVVTSTGAEIANIPNLLNRYNYSDPSHASQGLAAADRLILVNDPNAAAVIRWSGNLQGDYTNFTSSHGGGYKTLTSGNLMVPACVKLWQNPQSVDTLTILCMGTDGYSTGYYMAPSTVSSQSESTNIMGFEETTATPGTTSPYGCEVFNNSLYHPLDDQLMKSTASNYNINHAAQTDSIRNMWEQLANKQRIVSSVHDNRLYYLVHNPQGESLEPGCWGNEIWVLDGAKDGGSWSRYRVQAHSLRKVEIAGRISMSVIRPDGIFYFDPEYGMDDYVSGNNILARGIPWYLETNTQGANRAHDAWAHLQQLTINLGFFQGKMTYGIKGHDYNGKTVDISKVVADNAAPGVLAFDIEDYLLVRRDMKEWFFRAGSVVEGGAVVPSQGQVSLVQYRYTPSTVNTGYEFGSIETFEYGRSAVGAPVLTDAGVPQPMIDRSRP